MVVNRPGGQQERHGPSVELWLVRHGETEWSRAGRHTSVTDLPLTAVGEEQARVLRPVLAGEHFDHVLTSPLQRARRTAELAGFPAAGTDADLREWEYGDYEGVTTEEIRRQVPDWTVWTRPCPNGETAGQVADRLDRVLGRIRAAGGRTLVFGHGHASRALAARWLGLSSEQGGLFVLDTATVSVLGHEHGQEALTRWNSPVTG